MNSLAVRLPCCRFCWALTEHRASREVARERCRLWSRDDPVTAVFFLPFSLPRAFAMSLARSIAPDVRRTHRKAALAVLKATPGTYRWDARGTLHQSQAALQPIQHYTRHSWVSGLQLESTSRHSRARKLNVRLSLRWWAHLQQGTISAPGTLAARTDH